MGPSNLTVLFGCGVWYVGPHHPCACPGRRVVRDPVVGVWKVAMELEIVLCDVASAGEGDDELCLEIVQGHARFRFGALLK